MLDRVRALWVANTDDVGPGGVWPAAVLSGCASAALFAASAWLALQSHSFGASIALGDWVALHAFVGLASGVFVTWLVVAGERYDRSLAAPGQGRVAAVRLSALVTCCACVCVAFTRPLDPRQALLLALACGAAALLIGALLVQLSRSTASAGLPRLDPLRVAPFTALLFVPLQDGATCDSLAEAWRVMLER